MSQYLSRNTRTNSISSQGDSTSTPIEKQPDAPTPSDHDQKESRDYVAPQLPESAQSVQRPSPHVSTGPQSELSSEGRGTGNDPGDTPTVEYPLQLSQAVNLSAQNVTQISESNWANKVEDFEIQSPIGYGSSAVVYAAIYKPLNKRVAVKTIDLDIFERNQIDELRRETAVMALSKHPHILPVYGSFVNGSKLYIVTPYLSAGSCLDIMKTAFPDGFAETSIAAILKQALEGLFYLHKNGHIHRDVKAGNLLMDEHGAVLLADFGVSSSLSENGAKRKTFVGTPCWMAPEVMEQAGYDFKADIWSFGITALELATGHAPFAKYPPMKVLMMTLANDPPTLDREHTKHKFSKMFKDMIDLCLQKDPAKRPTTEKLLQCPFFKQARKKDFLIKSVLSHVTPLDQRPHKKVPHQNVTSCACEQWDFDTPLDVNKAPYQQNSHPEIVVPTPKKHISFGDVVIRDPSTRAQTAPVSDLSKVTDAATHGHRSSSPASRKSRFVIEDGEVPHTTSNTPQNSHPSLSTQGLARCDSVSGLPGIGLGISPHAHSNCQEIEVKKGRFSVNQTPQLRPSTPSESIDTPERVTLPRSLSDEKQAFVRELSQERRSRFELCTDPYVVAAAHSTLDSGRDSPTLTKPGRLSSKSDASGSYCEYMISPEGRKKGRFELTGGTSTPSSDVHNYSESSPHSSHPGSPSTSPYGSLTRAHAQDIADAHMSHTVSTNMEALVRQTEQHRVLLHDMLAGVPTHSLPHTHSLPSHGHSIHAPTPARSRAPSDAKRPVHHLDLTMTETPRSSLDAEIAATLDHLRHLLFQSDRERDRLMHVNEALRRDIDRIKRSTKGQQPTLAHGVQSQSFPLATDPPSGEPVPPQHPCT